MNNILSDYMHIHVQVENTVCASGATTGDLRGIGVGAYTNREDDNYFW